MTEKKIFKRKIDPNIQKLKDYFNQNIKGNLILINLWKLFMEDLIRIFNSSSKWAEDIDYQNKKLNKLMPEKELQTLFYIYQKSFKELFKPKRIRK